jgi:hypothetical protein
MLGFESLEKRRVLDCGAVDGVAECVLGDSDGNGLFDQLDIVQVLQGGKYLSENPATWQQGDWNSDGQFNQLDVVAALQAGTYMQVPDDTPSPVTDLTSLAPPPEGVLGRLGRPTVIRDEARLVSMLGNEGEFAAISESVDFSTHELLLFEWQGSGGDGLTSTIEETDGDIRVVFVYTQGLTRDLARHSALFAVDQNVAWSIQRDVNTDRVNVNTDQRIDRQLQRWETLIESGDLPPGVTPEQADDMVAALQGGDLDRYQELASEIRVGRMGQRGGGQAGNRAPAGITDRLLTQWQTQIDSGDFPDGVDRALADEIVAALEDGDLQLFRELTTDVAGAGVFPGAGGFPGARGLGGNRPGGGVGFRG